MKVIDSKILKNGKDLDITKAIYKAFPDAEDYENFGITACGEDLVIR